MQSSLTINMVLENAAFSHNPEIETARILRELADRIEESGLESVGKIKDINGNNIGDVLYFPPYDGDDE